MRGPFDLTTENIRLIKNEPGVYVLGGKNSDGSYWGCYVGRSDEDVADRISYWFNLINGDEVPKNDSEKCIIRSSPKYYWREYTNSAREAYELECKIYHDHDNGYSCNVIHPAKTYSSWSCPICGE